MPSKRKATLRQRPKKSGSKPVSSKSTKTYKSLLPLGKKLKQLQVLGLGSSDEKFMSFVEAQFALEYAEKIISAVEQPLMVLDENLKIISANRSFYDTFKVKPKEIKGKLFYKIGKGEWDIPKLKKSLKELTVKGIPVQDFEVKQKLPIIGERTLHLTARRIYTQAQKARFILLGIKDVTKLKKAEESASQLASFPQMNPMPVLEIDSSGKLLYMNPAAKKLFPDLPSSGLEHPYLSGILPAVAQLKASKKEWIQQEVKVQGASYAQTILAVDKGSRIRIYAVDITERKKSEVAVQRAKEEWEQTFDTVPDLVAVLDEQHRIIRVNRAMADRLGVPTDKCKGMLCYKAVHGLVQPPAFCPHALTCKDGKEHTAEIYEPRLGGYFLVSTTPRFDDQGNFIGSVHVARDITERKKAEKDLEKLNRTLRALGHSNQALMYAQEEFAYLQDVCKIIIEDCGHSLVWIGFAEKNQSKTVRPVAQAGFEEGYLQTLNITWADTERGRGPTGTAIRSGKPAFCRNMLTDPRFKPWRTEAIKRGYRSSAVFPLISNNETLGAISIYSREPDGFSDDEVKLLSELADDLAYGITSIRLRNALKAAKENLEIRVKERTTELVQSNERLKEEIKERALTEQSLRLEEARLDALLRLSQLSEAPLNEITSFTLEQAIALTNSKIGFVGFLSEDEKNYTLHSVSKDVVKECDVVGNPVHWPVSAAGIWADAIRERKTLFVNDYSKPHLHKKGIPTGHVTIERFMVVPVFVGDRIVTIAGVGNKTSDYDKSDERQLVLLLSRMWDCAQKNRSREEIQKAYEELEEKVEQRTAELSKSNVELKKEISERERIEKALRESEEHAKDQASHLQVLLDTAPAVIWIAHDRKCHKITANRFGEELLKVKQGTNVSKSGTEKEKLAHYRVFRDKKELIPEEMPIQQVAASGKGLQGYSLDIVFDDGSVRSLLGDVTPLLDPQGQPDGAIAVFMDVTERRKATQTLRETTSYLENLFNYANAPIICWDTKFKITRFNHAFEHLTDYKAEEVIGKELGMLFPEKTKEESLKKIRLTLSGEYWEVVEIPILRKDGEVRLALWNSANVYAEDGKTIIATIAQGQNITERKRAEETLRQSEERLNRAQEIAHLGSWELNLLNNRLSWSDEVYRIFGLKPQEFGATYEAFLEAVYPEDRKAVDAAYSGSLEEGKDSYEIEHRIVRKGTGEVRIVHERCRHIRDEHGRVLRSLGMVHDITERKKVEEEIKALNEHLKQHEAELAASNKELEAFSYSVSHDLRAPLRNINGFSQALLEDYIERLDQKGRDYLKRIMAGTQRMGELIDDLLNLSVMVRKEMRREEVNLSEQARSIVDELKHAEPKRELEVKIQDNLRISGDPLLLHQLLENLLGNAWKFTSKNALSRIEFGSDKKDGKKIFFVKDNGVGFDMKYINKMFIPFQRLHSVEEFSGNGIGLAIVKRVVDRHGGRIWAEGEVDKGATFYFTLE